MEINRNNIFEIINTLNLKPDKDYGQNFLIDPNISERIVSLLDINEGDNALEIGPGIGSLSHYLAMNKNANIELVDIDQRMVHFLQSVYKENNVKIALNDIRKQSVSEYTKVLGNLPYNITTETIVYLLENARKCSRMVLMCQSEAFNRFNDLSGKEYGPASILVHLLGSIKRCFNVKPGSFYPAPKCTSTVFTIDIVPLYSWSYCLDVYGFSKKLFLNRRKTIHNNLSSLIGDKEKSLSILDSVGIKPTARPEEMLPQKFVDIYNATYNV